MIRLNEEEVVIEEETDIYFNDNRVKRILKSMYTTNSAIALPSFILLIPVSIHTKSILRKGVMIILVQDIDKFHGSKPRLGIVSLSRIASGHLCLPDIGNRSESCQKEQKPKNVIFAASK